jgi:hypothetical protein
MCGSCPNWVVYTHDRKEAGSLTGRHGMAGEEAVKGRGLRQPTTSKVITHPEILLLDVSFLCILSGLSSLLLIKE